MQLLQSPQQGAWTIADFLPAHECENMILFSEQLGYEEATVSLSTGAEMRKGIRNNERRMYQDAALAERLWQMLRPFCPSTLDGVWQAVGLNEQFRFYRYDIAQRFKRHIDGRFKRNEREESRITFMIYLNDDYTGGETAFDHCAIQPKQGNALCFFHELKHEGCPVLSGTKYVLRSEIMYRRD